MILIVTFSHFSYDALQYPVLLAYGEDGYSLYLKNHEGITSLQLYSFLAMPRSPLSIFFKARNLSQMYFTDMGVKVQTERLRWFRLNQTKLRAENYVHLKDSINSDGLAAEVQREAQRRKKQGGNSGQAQQGGGGKEGGAEQEGYGQPFILPTSYVGSPRYLHMR